MNKKSVAIIDYGMGNMFSVMRACEHVGLNPVLTSDKKVILEAEGAILPGVGAFGDAMENLKKTDLVAPIKDFISAGKPFMGICLGLQLLLSESEEFGTNKGLDIIKGRVIKFPTIDKHNERKKVPQVGWNRIYRPAAANGEHWKNSPLEEIKNEEFMYFVHSFYCAPEQAEVVLSLTDYEGTEYCSSVLVKNVFACQFHPEKSADEGLKIYKKWAQTLKNREEQ